VVARSVDGDTTAADLETYILSLPEARRQPAEGQKVVDWRREILEEMLVTRQLTQEASKANLLATDEGRSYVDARRIPLLGDVIRNRRIAETVEVTDEEMQRFYDEHPEEFGHGPQIRLRHIFKRTTREASTEEREAARREIDDLYRQLGEGAAFIELARNDSDSETASLDGLIGRLDPGALGPEIDRIVWALDEGEISEVVSTPTGFHIFKVENHIEPFKMEFAEARTRLVRRFTREETEATLAAYFDELLQASGAVFDPDGLEGDDDTVLFALDDFELARGDFLEDVLALGFGEQRTVPLREHLEQAATERLYRWEAERLKIGEEPEMVAHLERIEAAASVELAYRSRRRAHLEELEDSVLRAYHERNLVRFRTPQLLRLRLLVRRFEGEGQEWFKLYEELERVAIRIRTGELDFADEAARSSQDVSATRGGDSGWINPRSIGNWAGPRASKAILGLALDVVSEPILIERYNDNRLLYDREGYMLVRVEELRGAADPPFGEIRDQVAEHYVASGSEELQQQIRREVLEEIDAEIFQDRL
jgi:parvulin-like peptidyl-prolyl isomerase